jgi:hypothetical protein
MWKDLLKILLLTFLVFISSCQKTGSSSSGGLSILGDDTKQAVDFVNDANNDLKKVKQIYIENQGKVDDLKSAINDKQVDKVKSIADDLVDQINQGLVFGTSAVEKIDKARRLNISDAFKQYLTMKSEALTKQLDAFELRRQTAQVFRDGFGGKDPQAIEKAVANLKDKESSFKQLMEDGRALSQEANEYATAKQREKDKQEKK